MAPSSILLLQARNLELILDSFCCPPKWAWWFHLQNVSQVHPLVYTATATTIVHSSVYLEQTITIALLLVSLFLSCSLMIHSPPFTLKPVLQLGSLFTCKKKIFRCFPCLCLPGPVWFTVNSHHSPPLSLCATTLVVQFFNHSKSLLWPSRPFSQLHGWLLIFQVSSEM